MRVLVIAQYFPSDMGGGATRAYNVAEGLLKTGLKKAYEWILENKDKIEASVIFEDLTC